MRIIRFALAVTLLSFTLLPGCIEPYTFLVPGSNSGYLVVDGFISLSGNEGGIKLTRTQPLDADASPEIETDALVYIETSDHNELQMYLDENGRYVLYDHIPKNYDSCRLVINTNRGEVYESDFVPIMNTPEIDSINWKADDEGLHIMVNTHDPKNDTWYYRWDYEETMEYISKWSSRFVFDTVEYMPVPRTKDNSIFRCWATEKSTNVLTATSETMQRDVISEFPVTLIPPDSWKHGIKYSILVKQYALSKEGYFFWSNLKRFNENVGTLFDPQPGNIDGNLHCINDPDRIVLGFFSVGTVTEKRIFVKKEDLPESWVRITGYEYCTYSPDGSMEYFKFLSADDVYGKHMNDDFYDCDWISGTTILIGCSTSKYPDCIDCRKKHNGTNVKPDFWE